MQIFRRSDASPLAEWWRTIDKGLIAATLILMAAGLVLSLAAGPAAASRLGYDDPFYFVYRQAMFVCAAALVLIASSTLDGVWARRLCAALFVVCFIFLAVAGTFWYACQKFLPEEGGGGAEEFAEP